LRANNRAAVPVLRSQWNKPALLRSHNFSRIAVRPSDDEVFVLPCMLCTREMATAVCTTCAHVYCAHCFGVHDAHHHVELDGQMVTGTNDSIPIALCAECDYQVCNGERALRDARPSPTS
jgi:hypothetical protein